MSLFESGHSTGEMSLGAILRSEPVPSQHRRTTVTDLVDLVCQGGWLGILGAGANDAQRFVRDYMEEIRRTDIRRVDGIRRDPGAGPEGVAVVGSERGHRGGDFRYCGRRGRKCGVLTRKPFRAIWTRWSGSS